MAALIGHRPDERHLARRRRRGADRDRRRAASRASARPAIAPMPRGARAAAARRSPKPRALTDRDARPGVACARPRRWSRAPMRRRSRPFSPHNELAPSDIAVIGFHGQTVLHRPRTRLTVQIGDGAALAQRLGIPVVYRFSRRRCGGGRAGRAAGAGLPSRARRERSTSRIRSRCVNIGGVANVTYLDGETDPIAFDTGPGNALIDDLVRARTGEPLRPRRRARRARQGRTRTSWRRCSQIPIFACAPPKSLDRDEFARLAARRGCSTEDAAATATAIVAASIARAQDHLPKPPATWIVAGGGARNPALMRDAARAARRHGADAPTRSAGRRTRSRRRLSPISPCAR